MAFCKQNSDLYVILLFSILLLTFFIYIKIKSNFIDILHLISFKNFKNLRLQ